MHQYSRFAELWPESWGDRMLLGQEPRGPRGQATSLGQPDQLTGDRLAIDEQRAEVRPRSDGTSGGCTSVRGDRPGAGARLSSEKRAYLVSSHVEDPEHYA